MNAGKIPMEVCEIIKGQFYHSDVPPETQEAFRKFSTKDPLDRLDSIKVGMQVSGTI